ncbi:type VI secretion system tip protein VgrG [Burkholderia sp. WAC0059]|uniref:type VI secretion system Vgr family protein n=1 Tax=Burkholderia sp. WAC0059 TaxID=2066022 RepID=UPI000C7F3C0E|nr:type VI secretion system tip protein TssI/VgrG [Burkholderia sp. WAC0059]PLZ00091.1 type VI secretion system tip protein VgrG [Burkholderia sp. WAC0059]
MIPFGATQAQCFVSVSTPFGTDVLLLDGLSGGEAISALFRFELRMRSTNRALAAKTIVGKSVTVTLCDATGVARYVNGIVTRFMNAGGDAQYGFYSATLEPRLWLLTLGRDRAIYQDQTALEIVESVLDAFQVPYRSAIANPDSYPKRTYCVQYDESAFQFVSRLMEDEGIFYFFTFADGAHTLVLADSASAWQSGVSPTLYFEPDSTTGAQAERIAAFEMGLRLGAMQYLFADYDSETAQTSRASASASGATPTGWRYTFPGKYASEADADRKAAIRLAAHQVQTQTGHGAGFCYGLAAGTTFTLRGHPDTALDGPYVVRAVTHTASNDSYGNTFEAFPLAVPFRAPVTTPLPLVSGTHTANVVGPQGEEIWTDAYGRIKVKFHWDRSAVANENSSCWVRVSQVLAGPGWGHLFLPRVGQEVVVSYVDGDPDRPLVTGCVYNRSSTLPVALPDRQTQSVIRSRSSKNGVAGNEIRMEDKLDAEEFYVHAQRDMNLSVENALTTTVIGGAETHVVKKGDRTVQVQTGSETHTVKGTRSLTVGSDETHSNDAAFAHSVSGDYTLKVSGSLVIDVSGSVSIKAGTSLVTEAGTTHGSKAGTTLSAQGSVIEQKASAAQTIDGGGLLQLKGGVVQVN